MAKFIMLYRGEATDMGDMSPEEQQEVMTKWGEWMQRVGPALSDVGAPFGPGASVVDDGSMASPSSMSGYSIVEAADLDAAKALTSGHPYLSEGKGDYAIDIFELMPVPM